MSAIRHTTTVMQRAVELYEAGWQRGQIPHILERELGVKPGRNTILRWTSEEYAERERLRSRAINVRRWSMRWRFNLLARATPECREAFIHRLNAEGVPKQSIAKVCTVVFGEQVSRDQVRLILAKAPA